MVHQRYAQGQLTLLELNHNVSCQTEGAEEWRAGAAVGSRRGWKAALKGAQSRHKCGYSSSPIPCLPLRLGGLYRAPALSPPAGPLQSEFQSPPMTRQCPPTARL